MIYLIYKIQYTMYIVFQALRETSFVRRAHLLFTLVSSVPLADINNCFR